MKNFLFCVAFVVIFCLTAINSVPMKVPKQSQDCQICQEVATIVEYGIQFFGWNSSKVYHEMMVACGYVSNFKTECDLIVYEFGKELATCFTKPNVNITTCCTEVFLCEAPSAYEQLKMKVQNPFLKNNGNKRHSWKK